MKTLKSLYEVSLYEGFYSTNGIVSAYKKMIDECMRNLKDNVHWSLNLGRNIKYEINNYTLNIYISKGDDKKIYDNVISIPMIQDIFLNKYIEYSSRFPNHPVDEMYLYISDLSSGIVIYINFFGEELRKSGEDLIDANYGFELYIKKSSSSYTLYRGEYNIYLEDDELSMIPSETEIIKSKDIKKSTKKTS